jgi:hypothetical protein
MRDDNASFFITVRDPALALGTRWRCGGVGGGTVDVAAVVSATIEDCPHFKQR